MLNINYFQFICFLWATIGIVSRIAMTIMGEKWSEWELKNAYKIQKPKWIYVVGVIGYAIVIFTWYKHFTTDIKYSLIITIFISLTIIKLSALLFNYYAFRKFVVTVLNDKNKKLKINISVVVHQ